VVDPRGLVVTNRHVIEEMEKVPREARFVMVFPRPEEFGETIFAGILARPILQVFVLDAIEAPAPLFGQANPDFSFAEIDLQGLPCSDISAEGNVIEVGSEIVTMGFPMGERYLSPYSDRGVSQISPFARHGIISSVLPCECKHPHGFSVDVLSEGGASGSPILLAEEGTVIGILHASFDHAPVTYGVPGWILKQGLDQLRQDWEPIQGKATLNEVVEAEKSTEAKPFEWTRIFRVQPAADRHG
jgi:S1-C subfamily serine protease